MKKSGTKGLTTRQAEESLRQYGLNLLVQKKDNHLIKIFAGQFRDTFVLILLAATAASFFMGNVGEALTIIAIVFLNAVLGFVQEYRTEKTLEALKELSAPKARVYRDGRLQVTEASQLVPGDYIILEAGDRVPADAVLDDGSQISCNESMLSGESVPVSKKKGDKIYMGTTVVQGRGKAEVFATGMNTQMGHIAHLVQNTSEELTPLQQRLDEMGKWIGIGCLLICGLVSVIGYLRGEPLFQMIMLGISLAVAAIPEGLCAIVTVSLALSVRKMLKRKALVRRLHAIETLGCADVICTDKTGTLTQNKMTVTELFTFTDHHLCADSSGKWPSRKVSQHLLWAAALCNSCEKTGGKKERYTGDPTETALIEAAQALGCDPTEVGMTLCGELPFDPVRKMMSVVVKNKKGELLQLTKGAPDFLLKVSTHYEGKQGIVPLSQTQREQFQQKVEEMSARGLRVLAFAFRQPQTERDLKEHNLILVGAAAMKDPPRQESYSAVKACRCAGIRPVMITGDSAQTAQAIAQELHIFSQGDGVITGGQLENMSDQQLYDKVENTSVYCRVAPEHKLRIVKALKKRGHIVAMTGDGVNDAPAIKEADIGVSMGKTGTDIAREASAMVLLDDNFSTLVSAVEEGRTIYANIRKFLRYLLSCNVGEVFTMFAGMIMGLPVVLTPIQILLVNLVTDGLPALALGADPPQGNEMHTPPRRKDESVFSGGLFGKICFRGCLIGISTLFSFVALYALSSSLQTARGGALLTLVSAQLFHAFECRSEHKTLFESKGSQNIPLVLSVMLSAIIIAAVVCLPKAAALFEIEVLTPFYILYALLAGIAVPLVSSVAAMVQKLTFVLQRKGKVL